MYKEKLRQLKRINATPHMIDLANEKGIFTYESPYGGESLIRNVRYDLLVRCQTRGGILMICLFMADRMRKGELTPAYEIYCNPEGKEYITRVLEDGREVRWSSAMADNLEGMEDIYIYSSYSWYKGREKRIWQNPEGKETIKKFLGVQSPGMQGLVEWQRKIRRANIEEKEAREKAPWDKDMSLVPPLPPCFAKWALKQSPDNYIFYHYKDGGAEEGYCSHCGHWVPIQSPRHLRKCRCPKCGAAATFRATGKISTLRTEEYYTQIVQKYEGGIVVRIFDVQQWYKGPEDIGSPNYRVTEVNRTILPDAGASRRYRYGLYKNKEYRWIPDQYWPGGRCGRIVTYTKNLKILKKTKYRNSAAVLWKQLPLRLDDFLEKELAHPLLEKTMKAGLPSLAYDLAAIAPPWKQVDETETELTKALRIDTARLRRLKEMDGEIFCLRWLQTEKTNNTLYENEMITDFSAARIDMNELIFPHLIGQKPAKIWRYLTKQRTLSEKAMRKLLQTWKDYLNMADKARMDIQNSMILYPKDLYAAHQQMILLIQEGEMEKEARKLEKKWPQVNQILPALKKYEYTKGGYTIVTPKNILDIVKEGHALQHCVHTCDFYFDRIQKHESYLFFLRRASAPDTPWYTLEVEPSGNIRQKRTTGDNQGKDLEEAVKFLKAWQKDFYRKLTKEEKEQGKRADQARRQEYEKLRADGNRVWHGRLAGQLLADVLEQDFMPQEITQGDVEPPPVAAGA